MNRKHSVSFAILLVFILLQSANGLTIYRIGGTSLPAPDIPVSHEFVQLDWVSVEPTLHGELRQLDVANGSIAPVRLNPNVNLTPLIESEFGGQIQILEWAGWKNREEGDAVIFDGDPETAYLGDGHYVRVSGLGPQEKYWLFDLGGRFLLDRIRLFPREKFKTHRFIEKFLIGINDGDPLKDGTREYRLRFADFDVDVVHNISENAQPTINLVMPRTPVRYVLFEGPENTRGIWEVAEFEIYGIGPAPFSSFVSNVIDLGGPASIGPLIWSGQQDPGANIELSMRAGDDDDPNNYWRFTFRGDERSRFDEKGKPLNLRTYKQVESGAKAGVTHDTENWTFWNTAFPFTMGSGDMGALKSRQYVQVRADFSSTDLASGTLDYLQFAVSNPPVVNAALAEIVPVAVPSGKPTLFTYKIKPHFLPNDLGFDTIVVNTPAHIVGIDAVRVGGVDVSFKRAEINNSGFAVQIPLIDTQLTSELIEVDFRAEVFAIGTVFSGQVLHSERPYEVPQGLTPGDADPLADGDRLQVDLIGLKSRAIQAMRLSGAVFTPNGDGINDQLDVEYDLINILGDVPVQLGVFDLSGRYRGAVVDGNGVSGRSTVIWDGLDGDGRLLSPGLYVLRLEVQADSGVHTYERAVSIAY